MEANQNHHNMQETLVSPSPRATSPLLNKTDSFRSTPQVQCTREVGVSLRNWRHHGSRRVAIRPEPGETPCFGFVGIDRERIGIAPAGVLDMISTAANGALVPGIHDVKHQRGVDRNGRM